MKFTLLTLCALLSLGVPCGAQSSRPLPAGLRHAQELEAMTEGSVSPAGAPRSSVDTKALQRDADELADLAASVPGGVKNVNKGLLAKDLLQKLKQIEKLSKHLRSELNR